MAKYVEKAKNELSWFIQSSIIKIPREENQKADALSRLSDTDHQLPRKIKVEMLESRSIDGDEEMVDCVTHSPSWMDPIIEYLRDGTLTADKDATRKLIRQAAWYVFDDDELYRRSFTMPLLRCLRETEAHYVIREVHEGICGNHLGTRSLVGKIIRQGYYWPTMSKDCEEFVRKCEKCQLHATIPRLPPTELTAIASPCPFAQWGLDILGPLTPTKGGCKYLFVAVDYFTKWVEAEPTKKIDQNTTLNFIWRSIFCRFGVPRALVMDNRKQFDNSKIRDLCTEYQTQFKYASVAHPMTNGQAEVTNRTILYHLKTRLDQMKSAWADELPSILWAYRTTPRRATGETPFRLTFSSEAVVPVEIGAPSTRIRLYNEATNDESLREELDLLEEVRETASLRNATY
jgi:hypothetical protein